MQKKKKIFIIVLNIIFLLIQKVVHTYFQTINYEFEYIHKSLVIKIYANIMKRRYE